IIVHFLQMDHIYASQLRRYAASRGCVGSSKFARHPKCPGLVPTPTIEFWSTGGRGAVEWSLMQRKLPFDDGVFRIQKTLVLSTSAVFSLLDNKI
ncbi:hypothetical protein NRY68_08050, partial [Acidithiobacillus ferrooxidans]|uniref:hypothetical protein n=1 Tax=Acidithiobacillus ferrooxidans TaxID=920 RepID=UPI002147FCAD